MYNSTKFHVDTSISLEGVCKQTDTHKHTQKRRQNTMCSYLELAIERVLPITIRRGREVCGAGFGFTGAFWPWVQTLQPTFSLISL